MRIRRKRTIRERSKFWNDWGALVYLTLVGGTLIPAVVFVPAEAPGGVLVVMFALVFMPAVPVLAMGWWRYRQYMRQFDE